MDQNSKIRNKILKEELKGIAESLKVLTFGMSKEQFAEVLQAVSYHLEKPKGDKGEPGENGMTPERGKDYWTKKDIQVLISSVAKQVPIPKRGKDYWTKSDMDFVVNEAFKKIVVPKPYVPKKGKDFYTKAERKELIVEIVSKLNKTIESRLKTVKADTTGFVRGDGVSRITVGPTAPVAPQEGDLWVELK